MLINTLIKFILIYRWYHCKRFYTRNYGQSEQLLVDIGVEEFVVLPGRLASYIINDKILDLLNEKKYQMRFHGNCIDGKPTMHIFEFLSEDSTMDMKIIKMFELEALGERVVKQIKTMEINEKYQIVNMRLLRTVFGKKVVVDYDDTNYFYLPNHFCDIFKSKKDICEIINGKFTIIFKGTSGTEDGKYQKYVFNLQEE